MDEVDSQARRAGAAERAADTAARHAATPGADAADLARIWAAEAADLARTAAHHDG